MGTSAQGQQSGGLWGASNLVFMSLAENGGDNLSDYSRSQVAGQKAGGRRHATSTLIIHMSIINQLPF